MTPSFTFSVDSGARVTGFSLGDLTVTGSEGVANSTGAAPRRSMMVFVSLVGLLDGIAGLLRDPAERRFEFVGTDSSFRLVFERRGDRIVILHNGDLIDESDPVELARAALTAGRQLRARWDDALDGEAITGDLDAAIADLQALIG